MTCFIWLWHKKIMFIFVLFVCVYLLVCLFGFFFYITPKWTAKQVAARRTFIIARRLQSSFNINCRSILWEYSRYDHIKRTLNFHKIGTGIFYLINTLSHIIRCVTVLSAYIQYLSDSGWTVRKKFCYLWFSQDLPFIWESFDSYLWSCFDILKNIFSCIFSFI